MRVAAPSGAAFSLGAPQPTRALARPAPRPLRRVAAAAESQDKSVDDALAAANALLAQLGGSGKPASPSVQQSIDELQEMGFVCDESGCVLVALGDTRERAAGPPPISRLLTGSNWSLGMLDAPDSDDDSGEEGSPYTALVAGPCWSVPLKPSELGDFVSMLSQLRLMVANLDAQSQWHGGSAERPASRVKWETNHIVMKAAYAPKAPGFEIEMTFRTDRRSVTTHWPAEVAAAVIAAVDREVGVQDNSSSEAARVETATVSA